MHIRTVGMDLPLRILSRPDPPHSSLPGCGKQSLEGGEALMVGDKDEQF